MQGKESMPGLWETNDTADHDQIYSITAEADETQTTERKRR